MSCGQSLAAEDEGCRASRTLNRDLQILTQAEARGGQDVADAAVEFAAVVGKQFLNLHRCDGMQFRASTRRRASHGCKVSGTSGSKVLIELLQCKHSDVSLDAQEHHMKPDD